MNLDKQRIMALAIMKHFVAERVKEGEDLEDGADEFIEELGEEGLKLFSNNELRTFIYALADQTPPPKAEEAAKD